MLQQKVHGEAIKPHPLVGSRGKHTGPRSEIKCSSWANGQECVGGIPGEDAEVD